MQEEEAREPELVDELQLVLEPCTRLAAELVARRIALLEGAVADVRKLDDRRLRAVREVRIAVAELLGQVEAQPLGKLDGSSDRSAVLRETLHHLGRREQDALVIAAPLGLAAVEGAAVTDGDEDVLQGARREWCAWTSPVTIVRTPSDSARSRRPALRARVAALVGTLELDEETLAAECAGQPRGSVRVAHRDSVPRAAGEADEPVVQLLEQTLIECRVRRRLGFLSFSPRLRMCSRDQPAEIRVPLRRLDEDGHVRAVRESQLGAGDGTHAEVLGRVRELERAVHPVVVGERECGIAELGGADGELLRQRRPSRNEYDEWACSSTYGTELLLAALGESLSFFRVR